MRVLSILFVLSTVLLTIQFTPADEAAPAVFDQYQALFNHYPAKAKGRAPKTCHALDFETNAQAKKYVTRLKAEVALVPNFALRYIAFGTPTSGSQEYFIADCKTGQIYSTQQSSAGVLLKLESSLMILSPPVPKMTFDDLKHAAGGVPRLFVWKPSDRPHRPNTLQSVPDPIFSKLSAEEAQK